MKIINDKGYSELNFAWIKYISGNHGKPIPGDFSATEISNPYKAIILFRKHYDEITVNASDIIYPTIGTALHESRHNPLVLAPNTITERKGLDRLKWIDGNTGFTLSGQPDTFDLIKRELGDLKSTTMWNLDKKREDTFSEWKMQLSIYRFLMLENSFLDVSKKAVVTVFTRDYLWWKASDKCPSQIFEITIDLDDERIIKDHVKGRLLTLKDIMDKRIPIPDCTEKEKWPNDKTGEYTKCLKYCNARTVCDFAIKLKGE
jgi:hypothetical protein